MTEPRPTPPPQAALPGGHDVRFFELAGTDARSALAPLAEAWRRGGADVELLASVERSDLWLLVARGGREPHAHPVPAGTRVWRFRREAP